MENATAHAAHNEFCRRHRTPGVRLLIRFCLVTSAMSFALVACSNKPSDTPGGSSKGVAGQHPGKVLSTPPGTATGPRPTGREAAQRRSLEALCKQMNEHRVAWLTEERDRLLRRARRGPTDELSEALSRVGYQRSLLMDEGVEDCKRRMGEDQARCILAAASPEEAAKCPESVVRRPEERPDAELCERLSRHLTGLLDDYGTSADLSDQARSFVKRQQRECLEKMTQAEVRCLLQVSQLRGDGMYRCFR